MQGKSFSDSKDIEFLGQKMTGVFLQSRIRLIISIQSTFNLDINRDTAWIFVSFMNTDSFKS